MSTAIAMQIILIMLILIALLLWLDSPTGKPRDGRPGCGIKGCRWHGERR